MIDMTLIDKYIDESFPDDNVVKREYAKRNILKMLNTKEDVPVEQWTRQDFVNAFSQRQVRFSSFAAYKSYFKDYLKWLYENGKDVTDQIKYIETIFPDEIVSDEYISKYYFADLNDLLSQIQDLLCDREEEFYPFICAAILVWYGFDIRSIQSLLKTDVSDDSDYIVDRATGQQVLIDKLSINMIREYRDAEVYKTAKMGGKMVHYKFSNYLFRNCFTAQMTDRTFNNMLIPINKLAKEINMQFNWKRIATSGTFYRVYEYEMEHGNLTRYSYDELAMLFHKKDAKLTQGTKQGLVKYYDEYLKFKNIFYGT